MKGNGVIMAYGGGRIILEVGGHAFPGSSVVNDIVDAGNFEIPVQTTTREQRKEEDYSYDFVTKEAFQEYIEHNEMFEYFTINDIFWGTRKSAIDKLLKYGRDVFVRIGDYGTAVAIKKQYNHIFLLVVDMEEASVDWGRDNNYEECKECADYVISKEHLNQGNRISEENLEMFLKEIETKAKRVVNLSDDKEVSENIIYKNALFHVATYLLDKQMENVANNMCSLIYKKNIEKIEKKIGKMFEERMVFHMYLYIRYLDKEITEEEIKKYLTGVTFADVEQRLKSAEELVGKMYVKIGDEEGNARIYNEFISENNISENEIIGQLQGNETDIDLVIGGDGMARFVIVKLNDGFPDRLLEIGNIHLQDVVIVEKQPFPEALRASCIASVLYNKALGDSSKNICRDQNLAYLLSDKLKKAAKVYHECLDAKNNA